jgi:hypothetical protein
MLLPPQMFGPYAALKLGELSEGVVLDCLGQLDECLARWKELLDPVTMAVVVSGAAWLVFLVTWGSRILLAGHTRPGCVVQHVTLLN